MNNIPIFMAESILTGIVELDPRDRDNMLPAFFAYRMHKIPGMMTPITPIYFISNYFVAFE